MFLLNILFPKYCVWCRTFGSYLCSACFSQLSFETQVICLVCGKGSFDGLTHPRCRTRYSIDGVFCAISYRSVAKKLIYVLKYQPYVSDVQHMLVDLFYESLIQKELFLRQVDMFSVFSPVPLSSKKLRKRGYNQSFLLAKGLAKKFHRPISEMLVRKKDTKPQFGLSREERKTNMRDAFFMEKYTLPYSTVLLVDDVLTTGATLFEAARVLKQHGVQRVWGVTFSRD